MYTCDSCTLNSCTKAEADRYPENCPVRDTAFFDEVLKEYARQDTHEFYVRCSAVEAQGYCQWVRLKETLELCRQMNYDRVGMAFCSGLKREAKVIGDYLRSHGLKVVSVMCKAGGIPKEKAGVPPECKINAEAFEAMCNPVAQAKLLNAQKTQFNIVVGLCVGHDSLFYKHSEALVTTLIAKDRVLAHNPAGAVYCAEGYYKKKLLPEPRKE